MTEDYLKALRELIAAHANCFLVSSVGDHGPDQAKAMAMGNVEGAAMFLVKQIGPERASEFFYRLADGIAAPMPQSQEK
jgi:hypothetical protein